MVETLFPTLDRTARQNEITKHIIETDFNGSLVAATGFGKTRVGIQVLAQFLRLNIDNKACIIVPTVDLQIQWYERLKEACVDMRRVSVFIINTAYKQDEIDAGFFILDEAHRYGAPEFSRILTVIGEKPCLMLTATMKRTDGMEAMLLQKSPIVDVVTIQECLVNGWVAPFMIYNLALPLTMEERIAYEAADKKFKSAAANCGGLENAMHYIKAGTPEQKRLGFQFMRTMRARKTACQITQAKLPTVISLFDIFSTRRGIVFCEDIVFAESVYTSRPDITVLLHSKLPAKQRMSAKTTFAEDKSKRILSTVRAANEGIDIPDLSLGVIAAGTSVERDLLQRVGRTIRKLPGKQGLIVNLYTKETQSMVWLKNALKPFKSNEVAWIESLEEIPRD